MLSAATRVDDTTSRFPSVQLHPPELGARRHREVDRRRADDPFEERECHAGRLCYGNAERRARRRAVHSPSRLRRRRDRNRRPRRARTDPARKARRAQERVVARIARRAAEDRAVHGHVAARGRCRLRPPRRSRVARPTADERETAREEVVRGLELPAEAQVDAGSRERVTDERNTERVTDERGDVSGARDVSADVEAVDVLEVRSGECGRAPALAFISSTKRPPSRDPRGRQAPARRRSRWG